MDPYYTIMRLPKERDAEFVQMLPFTPRRKDNLAAWMVARSDGAHYGRMFVFRFPKQKVVFGPRQIVARINQDQVISPQITLWNQQGSEVIQGTLLVIPIEESLLYVRPLYLRAAGGKIPELKRVIVAYHNQIVMEETLDAAIAARAKGWALDRMPVLDLNILRLGSFELAHRPDVPIAVAIDEAVELAKRFSTDDSGKFVNGVLAALVGDLRQ
jgi:transcription antitermination factor NusB